MWGDLHEEKKIIIKLPAAVEAGKGNRLLRELGATLHYDVYGFDAKSSEVWYTQSRTGTAKKNKKSEPKAGG